MIDPVGICISGVKNAFCIFFSNQTWERDCVNPLNSVMDIRSLINFQSVDLNFYSLIWVEDQEIYSVYMATYDWNNRNNGYVAVSLSIPEGKRVVGGVVPLLDRLMGMYKDQYVGEDWKIKNIKENPMPFLQVVESAWMVEEPRPKRLKGAQIGAVRYAPGAAAKFLENPYREEFEGFERVFFLPKGQKRLSLSPAVQPIELLGYGTEISKPVTYPVSVRPKLPGRNASQDLVVQINGASVMPGQNGVFTRNFTNVEELVSVTIECEGYLPKTEQRTVRQWGEGDVGEMKLEKMPAIHRPAEGKEIEGLGSSSPIKPPPAAGERNVEELSNSVRKREGDSTVLPSNSKVWDKTGQTITGPFSLEILLKDMLTRESVDTYGKPVKLTVNNLGGTFYSSSSVIRLAGLNVNDVLEGTIEVFGYRTAVFNYTVSPTAELTKSSLPREIVLLTPVKKGVELKSANRGVGTTERNPNNNTRLSKSAKVVIAMMVASLLLGMSYVVYSFLTAKNEITGKDRTALSTAFEERSKVYQDSIFNDLIKNHERAKVELERPVKTANIKRLNTVSLQKSEDELQIAAKLTEELKTLRSDSKSRIVAVIDTSTVRLPGLDELMSTFEEDVSKFSKRIEKNTSEMINLKKALQNDLQDLETESKYDAKKQAAAKAMAKKAVMIANEARIFTVKEYDRYIRISISGSTKAFFRTSQERSRVNEKLKLMKRISALLYNARNDVSGNKVRWLSELDDLSKDPSLTVGQKKLVKQKMNAIPL